MLSQLKRYLQQHEQASLADIAHHFDVSPEVARQMLGVWIKKGRVSRSKATAACGSSCSQCDPASIELYRWGAQIQNIERDGCRK